MDTTLEIAPEINETGRAELIEEISILTGISTVDSATWSCLWFSDMERLQEIVDAVHESRTGLTTNLIINLLVGSQSVQALRSWTARGRKKSDDDDDSTPDTPSRHTIQTFEGRKKAVPRKRSKVLYYYRSRRTH
ncbi:hypothetical protein DTO027B5_6495 [Paecilomyces variotii]|nr:hypothetical protein DTO032I3_6984 [Paecilomyces variotii]KAJ9225209.1 hypothetical protein DTO169C6_2550 [Paecilomyces variotii]KAJ9263574.1 hypothetical protein DTO195F2_2834 [Paecilomyces variotii]KAJ9281111.1 hypothetical protein DTO021D3_2165 [Paecilomyces variotii]KAJ9325246.1 hypothetical protein DTO027B3_3725 [Paecilomyces variotii]